MTRSLVACAVDARESSVVRLKTSTGDGFVLSGCMTIPAGLAEISSPKGQRALKKLAAWASKWAGEPMALSVAHDTYRPLPASFRKEASDEECLRCSRMEASYFLSDPQSYGCDILPYGTEAGGELERKLLLFWPQAAQGGIERALGERHEIVHTSTPLKTAVGMTEMGGGKRVLLELGKGHVLLLVASGGSVEQFMHRPARNREESCYFALRKLSEAGLAAGTPVQLRGAFADRGMQELIRRESGCEPVAETLPPSLSVSGMPRKAISSPSAQNAIMTAIRALG